MMVQAFIFNWVGQAQKARALLGKLEPLAAVTVINSDDSLRDLEPDWAHVGDDAYFCAQWNAAIARFDADIFFHIQADADCDHFDRIFERAMGLFERRPIGIYEPDLDWTAIQYGRSKLALVEPDIYRVAVTDCTCWFIHGDVIRRFPPIDLSVNALGWGVPTVVAALGYGSGRICVRDYGVHVDHPYGRGYSSEDAKAQRNAWVEGLDPALRSQMDVLIAELRRTRPSGG